MKRTILYVIALVVVSLGAGVIVGAGIGRNVGYAKHPKFKQQLGPPQRDSLYRNRAGVRNRAFDTLSRKLNLSGEQAEKIRNILEVSRAKIEASKRETLNNFVAIKEATNAKIKEVLTPQQQAAFDRLTFERKQREGSGVKFTDDKRPPSLSEDSGPSAGY